MRCLLNAWATHKAELRAWLRGHLGQCLGGNQEIDDLMQELFLKAWYQGQKFCNITDPRAWFFAVARNAITDRLRVRRELVELPEDLLKEEATEVAPVDGLAACIPRALAELSADDRDIITHCDLGGMTQAEFANLHGITLAGAKSRVQRARRRLRTHLIKVCQVRFDDTGQVCGFVPRPPNS